MESAGQVWGKGELPRAIQALYVDRRASVKVGGMVWEQFDVHCEVRQGCMLSPWLFQSFIDNVMREARGSL